MERCYLLVNVQEIRIQPYFCVKQGDYFFSLFLGHPVCRSQNAYERMPNITVNIFIIDLPKTLH